MQSFGLLGKTLGHSLSPMLHAMIYQEVGYDGAYNLFEVAEDEIGKVLPSLRTLGIKGINVTIPYKQKIIPHLDLLAPEAKQIGAVNTIAIGPDGKATGHNTDAHGFLMQLQCTGIPVKGKRFVLCGMSGAGHAVCHALTTGGAGEVMIASTDPSKGVSYDVLKYLEGYDTIINCTPLGMHPKVDESIVGPDVLERFDYAVDIVYNPHNTRFLQLAQNCGLQISHGLYMLVFQGIKSFEIWTGISVGQEVGMRIFDKLKTKFL